MSPAAKRVTLGLLERLSDEGDAAKLEEALQWCSTKQIRSFFAGLGVRIRSKEYEAYHTKKSYIELLTQLLAAKTANKGVVVAPSVAVMSTGRTRKTKNCNLRLTNVLFSDAMAPFIDQMNARPTQEEREAGAVGGNNPFWTRLQAEFVSDKPEYAAISVIDDCFAGFDLSTPVLHSSKKLREMWGELSAAFTGASKRFHSVSNPGESFLDSCLNRPDVYYLHCWLEVKPALLWTTTGSKLPPTIQLRSIAPEQHSDSDDSDASIHSTRKRKRGGDVSRLLAAFQAASQPRTATPDEERIQLLQTIKESCQALSAVPVGSDLHQAIQHELEQHAIRLKGIQQRDIRESTLL